MRTFALSAGLVALSAFVAADADCPETAPCMTLLQAQQVANNFRQLEVGYTAALANEYLTPNYTDYSDSVIELIDAGCSGPITLGAPTFTSRSSYEAAQGKQPATPFNILNLWHTCDTVAIRWETDVNANATEDVRGLIVLETVYQANSTLEPFLIDTVYSEFNSGAWLVDEGVWVPNCTTTSSKHKHRH